MLVTIERYKAHGYINIAATVRQTARWFLRHLSEINAEDIALELSCQGLDIVDTDDEITDANMHQLSLPQIKRALYNNFRRSGGGYYINGYHRS